MNTLTIGEQVRVMRQRRDWTQVQLAEQAQCAVRTLIALEAGYNIRHETLQRIAKALNCRLVVSLDPLDPPKP